MDERTLKAKRQRNATEQDAKMAKMHSYLNRQVRALVRSIRLLTHHIPGHRISLTSSHSFLKIHRGR
jgi:hypothetical protein